MSFTEESYKEYEAFICKKFDVDVIDRNDVPKIQELSKFIDVIRIFAPNMPKGDEWIESWSFAFANRLFIAKTDDPIARASILAHEAQHGLQWHRKTPQADIPPHFYFMWLYVTEQEARVRLEVEAYRAGHEVHHMLSGTLHDARSVGSVLEGGYLLSAEQAKFAEKLYEPAELSMSYGVYSTEVAVASKSFFDERGLTRSSM